ncbi:DUF6906 family protein [Jeotgalibacillus aurantiacus]|uniref:DUF6906 family protein n=1 Tax=Jeotgalibacillus aurantiacus TaxID=2763266 RepID=UPI001D0AE7F2|nr:hypothetical protein [Jeotgalibacillus aurantiacus]
MKSGKRPTRAERQHMLDHGCNPNNWLVSKKAQGVMLLIHRFTNQTKEIPMN